jgi:ATP-binding cassette, subfamily B, bacterial PglK
MIKKCLSLLTEGERKRLCLLIFVMVITAVIEVAGIASIIPFLSLISNPQTVYDNKYLNWAYGTLNFESVNSFLIFTGIAVLLFLIFSNILLFLSQWGLLRFTWMRKYSISRRLLIKYIYQPYKFFLNQNTTYLSKNILSEVEVVIKGLFVPLLEILAKSVVTVFIFAMLVAVEPLLAISLVIVLGSAYILTYRLIKRRLDIRGKLRYKANAARFRAVNEAFSDIKLVKLRRFENFFVKRFSKPAVELAKLNSSSQIISYMPKYITEIIAFGGIIIVVLYLLARGEGFEAFLPLIGLYAFATYRLLPAIQSIFSGFAHIRFNLEALDRLYYEMKSFQDEGGESYKDFKKKIKPMPFRKDMRLENVTFKYDEANKTIIKNLSINIDINTSVAFVGSTGAGKTTVANIILGLLKPESGNIIVDDKIVDDKNMPSWQQNIGYVPQDIYLQDETVTHNITFGVMENEINMDAVIKAAKIANIHDFIINELPYKYDTIIGEKGVRLSGGQRQRIGIARALYHDPAVLVLDEATSALDSATEVEVFKAIQNIAKTKTLVIIAHRLTTIKDCDVIYVMDNGKIVGSGKYDELMGTNRVFKKLARVT